MPRSFLGSGKRVCTYRILNNMQSSNTDHQSIDPCRLYVPGDLKFNKKRRDEASKCPRDYDLEALRNFFVDISCRLSENVVNMVLHSMLKHKNQLDTFLSMYKSIEAISAFSSAITYHKIHSDGFRSRPVICENEITFGLYYRKSLKVLQDQVRLTPGDSLITKYRSAPPALSSSERYGWTACLCSCSAGG